MTVSLLIIACDEEHRLQACIASARPVVDQVVVVVQRSRDRTLTLARALADVVIEHECHYASEPSRPDGIAACTGDWVLNLDADETLTDDARAHLAERCAAAPSSVGMFRLRVMVWAGRNLLQDARHPRLFRRVGATFGLVNHSPFLPPHGTAEREMPGPVWIESRKTWAEQKADDARYARLGGYTRSALYPTRPYFRPGTTDSGVWDAIVGTYNEYELPDDMTGQTVLDVGGHIGSFAHACLERGAAFVLTVEPDRSSFDVLCHNLAPHGTRVACVRAAAWRSDAGHETDRLCPSGYGPRGPACNPGAATVMFGGDYEEVAALSFDRLVSMCGGAVDWAKLDCEGSEGPILHTATKLGACRRVVGEWHEMHDPAFQECCPVPGVVYSPASLREVLERNGFAVTLTPTAGTGLGHFKAIREGEK